LKAGIWRSPWGRKLGAFYTEAMTDGDKLAKSDRPTEAGAILLTLQDDPAAYIVGYRAR
jgi:hypothetical protein